MNKRIIRIPTLLLFTLLFAINNLYGQHIAHIDSLKKTLRIQPEDTNKVKILHELSRFYLTNLPDSAILYAQASLKLSKSIKYNVGVAIALNKIGEIYYFKNDYKRARKFQNQAQHYAEKHNLTPQLANVLSSLALICQDEGDYVKAIDHYLASLKIEEQNKNKKGILKILGNMAVSYSQMGDYDNALANSFKALKIVDEVKNSTGAKASILTNIGVAYAGKENYGESLKYHKIALPLFRSLKDKLNVVISLCNIGFCYMQNLNTQAALPYVEEAYKLSKHIESLNIKATTVMNLGALRLQQKRYKEAIQYMKESLPLTKSKYDILQSYRNFVMAYSSMGNYKKAYEYYDKAYLLSDSLRNQEIFDKVASIQKGYELNKKQSEINRLSQDAKVKALELEQEHAIKYFLTGILFFVFIAAAFAYFGFRIKTKLNRKLKKGNEEIQRLNLVLEIRALRSQMDPHFVFNALNGLQYFLTSSKAEDSLSYLSMVAKLIRITLQNASRDWVKLSEEIQILKLYLQVEQYRFPNKFEFDFIVDAALENEKVPFLVIQPYVENAVLHGLLPRHNSGGKLTIKAEKQEDLMKVIIEDNGMGRGATVQKIDPMFHSMGSAITQERLIKLSLQLGLLMDATIEDLEDENGKPTGTRSVLTFELTKNEGSVAA